MLYAIKKHLLKNKAIDSALLFQCHRLSPHNTPSSWCRPSHLSIVGRSGQLASPPGLVSSEAWVAVLALLLLLLWWCWWCFCPCCCDCCHSSRHSPSPLLQAARTERRCHSAGQRSAATWASLAAPDEFGSSPCQRPGLKTAAYYKAYGYVYIYNE